MKRQLKRTAIERLPFLFVRTTVRILKILVHNASNAKKTQGRLLLLERRCVADILVEFSKDTEKRNPKRNPDRVR